VKWFIPASLVKFLIVGVANTLVGLNTIWITKELMGFGQIGANITGYIVGITVSFFLNKRWTFSFRGEGATSLLRFLLVFAVSYSANLTTVLGLTEITGRDSFWWQVCGNAPYSALFYVGCRWYAFPATRGRPAGRGAAVH
jgi:putative flippase GtrA